MKPFTEWLQEVYGENVENLYDVAEEYTDQDVGPLLDSLTREWWDHVANTTIDEDENELLQLTKRIQRQIRTGRIKALAIVADGDEQVSTWLRGTAPSAELTIALQQMASQIFKSYVDQNYGPPQDEPKIKLVPKDPSE